jgi:hypothetical protein
VELNQRRMIFLIILVFGDTHKLDLGRDCGYSERGNDAR